MKVKALFISDTHFGSKGSNADKLLETLKKYEPEEIYLIGDIIDGWLLKKRVYWTQDFTNAIRKLLSFSKNGTKVTYVTGNHDDFLRSYSPADLGNIQIVDKAEFNNYLIIHGDQFDGVVKLKWLGVLGSIGYELAIYIDRIIKKLGFKYYLSSYLKRTVKSAVKFITDFEKQLAYQAFINGNTGVICGHIHTPENKIIKVKDTNIHYLNSGDWIESNSYIVYSNNNGFEIKSYGQ